MVFKLNYIFASDPHGTGEKWIELVEKAKKSYPDAIVIFGGDYIDGRKHSKETLDYVIDSVKKKKAVAIKGNHEQLLSDFAIMTDNGVWHMNGAKTTIKSLFGRNYSKNQARLKLLGSKYYHFIKDLPLFIRTDNIIFVHAGVPLSQNIWSGRVENFMLWAREEYWYSKEGMFAHNSTGKVIVSGHTPTCLIKGAFDDGRILLPGYNNTCNVKEINYPGEKSRYFTDGGCHGGNLEQSGNVCVFDGRGNLLEVFS